MQTRNGERGVRNGGPIALFHVPLSAFALAVCACSPVTARPPFQPFPEALVATINAPPARVAAAAGEWLTGEGLAVILLSPRDGYVETAWHDAIKVRCWADPDVPGRTRLTVEPVYRPRYDPSRDERDLEAAVPAPADGHGIAQRLVQALTKKYGGP